MYQLGTNNFQRVHCLNFGGKCTGWELIILSRYTFSVLDFWGMYWLGTKKFQSAHFLNFGGYRLGINTSQLPPQHTQPITVKNT